MVTRAVLDEGDQVKYLQNKNSAKEAASATQPSSLALSLGIRMQTFHHRLMGTGAM